MDATRNDLQARVVDLETAVGQLRERIRRLERTAEPTALPPMPRPAGDAPVVPVRPVPTQPAPPARPRVSPRINAELEVVIGTSWLNRIGVIAIIAAAAYFLKYSFDNQWIGPTGRVVLTWLLGLALLGAGERYQRRNLVVFAQGLTGGGIAVLYFAVYAAFGIYGIVGFAPAFLMMVLITAAAVLLALRTDSMAIATLGLLGGFVTPLLLSGGGGPGAAPGQPVSAGLYGYFLLLDGATYILVRSRGWRAFGIVGLAAAFGLPVIVASGGTPNPSAALAYFFIVTSATLALSTQFAVTRLAWAALAGGFLFALWGGVYTLLPSDPYLVLAYYGALTIGTLVVADRHNWRGVGTTATVAAALVVSVLSRLPAIVLLGYLAIVDAAALVATIRRDWRSSDLVVLLASTPALLIVASDAPGAPALKIGGASLIFALFNLMPSLVRSAHTERRLVTVLLADAALALQMAVILGEDNWNALAIFAVALAAYHVLAAQLLLRRDLPRLPVLVNLGLALTALTAAIPLKLRGEAITLTWSVEAIALAWAASRIRNTWAGRAAFVVSALAILRLIGVETPSIASAGLITSAPGLAFTVGIAALAVCAHYLHRLPWTSREERYAGRALGVAAAALLLWWIGWEIDGAYDRAGAATAVVAGARQATLSAWLTLYGFALVVVGIWRDISTVRWGGIALLAITVFKVFLIDLAALAVVLRVMSLAVLGVLLILASLAYGRYRTRLSRPSSPRGT